jgi:hypothetical protein
VSLKYENLYYKYKQKTNLLMALKQQQQLGQRIPTASEDSVLSDFFAFLHAGGVGESQERQQVVIVANSVDLLPLLHQKGSPADLAVIAGQTHDLYSTGTSFYISEHITKVTILGLFLQAV